MTQKEIQLKKGKSSDLVFLNLVIFLICLFLTLQVLYLFSLVKVQQGFSLLLDCLSLLDSPDLLN